jgi:hypothetical protein
MCGRARYGSQGHVLVLVHSRSSTIDVDKDGPSQSLSSGSSGFSIPRGINIIFPFSLTRGSSRHELEQSIGSKG